MNRTLARTNWASGFGIFMIALVIAGLGGWIANIVKLIGMDFVVSGMLIARAVGIFVAPLGAVLGYV